jgi:hypothetical protein
MENDVFDAVALTARGEVYVQETIYDIHRKNLMPIIALRAVKT